MPTLDEAEPLIYCSAHCGRYTGLRTICDACMAALPDDLARRLIQAGDAAPGPGNPLTDRAEWDEVFEDWFDRAVHYLTGRSA